MANITVIKSEIDNFAQAIKTYFNGISSYISGSSGSCPSYTDLNPSIKNDELHTASQLYVFDGQSASYGAITQSAFESEAISRESRLVGFTRGNYNTQLTASLAKEVNYSVGEAASKISYITGKAPSQKGMAR